MRFRLDLGAIDNDGYLWIKIGLERYLDTIDLSRKSARYKPIFQDVQTYCLFLGYPRSGHSIIGSFIDAHPDALMAHRLDSLKYLESGRSLQDIFYLAMRNSERFARSRRKLTGYRYHIADHWQGKFKTLRVIGDQEGNWTSRRLGSNPQLLEQIAALEPVAVKLIHVIRNPYDNIATWARRTNSALPFNIERYFFLCRCVATVKNRLGSSHILDVHHEDLLKEPELSIRKLYTFLSLEPHDDLVHDCARIVYPSANHSRHDLPWEQKWIDQVKEQMREYDYLRRYSFDS